MAPLSEFQRISPSWNFDPRPEDLTIFVLGLLNRLLYGRMPGVADRLAL
jgi:hypothetical protein